MDKTIEIAIKNKIAVQTNGTVYVCGNDDFIIVFDFDDEWAEFTHKTARLIYNGTFVDIVFSGNQCAVPVLSDTYNFVVGVFAGDLRTTTPAYVGAKKSILCGTNAPAAPHPDVFAQMKELFGSGLDEAVSSAEAATEAKNKAQESQQMALDSEKASALSELNAAKAAKRAEELAHQVGIASGLQADLNVNDPAAAGYVHNRTHWVEYVVTKEILPETEAIYTDPPQNTQLGINRSLDLVEGEMYRVTYNGVDYDCVCGYYSNPDNGSSFYWLGNLLDGDVWYPFGITTGINLGNGMKPDATFIEQYDGATSVVISIKQGKDVVHPLAPKFMRLASPDGTVFELTVANDGTLSASPVAE